ncbi:MAG: hypothetical protein ACI8QZ_000858 [Chlamydiales bacterium]|jgi:hypothetical protein
MRPRPSRLLGASCALALLLLGTSLLLPPGAEVRRTRDLGAARAAIHPWLLEPARWPRWTPDWMAPGAANGRAPTVTATLPQRGVWYDLPGLGAPVSKGVMLYSDLPSGASSGTRVTWIVRTDVGLDPFRRWAALWADRRYGPQMEAALTRLAACVDQERALQLR